MGDNRIPSCRYSIQSDQSDTRDTRVTVFEKQETRSEAMLSNRGFSRAFYTGLLVLALGGCKQEGPAERAGRQLDEKIDDLTRPKGPAERAGEAIDKAVDDAGKTIEDAGRKTRKTVD